MIIPIAIFALSILFLVQFFVAYCRSLTAASYRLELSPETHEVTGIDDHLVQGDDFKRVLHLLRLCPESGSDRMQLASVRAYYGLVSMLRMIFAPVIPTLADWTERERAACGYFAAVALDRRIAHNRGMVSQQMGGQL